MLSTPFNECARNAHSQHGEDGIIERILHLLPCDKWCVEVGAWDGIYASNTYNIIKHHGYKAVLIEPDKKKFKVLKRNLLRYNAMFVNEYVNFNGKNTLDKLLAGTSIPLNFDFLSIDIDGCDYYIFESLVTYRPKLICIEYNPTIPNDVVFVQSKNLRVKQGASAKAIVDLARLKGYELLAITRCNLFLLDRSLLPEINLSEGFSLNQLRDDTDSKIHLFCGFDGSIITDKPVKLIWHDLPVNQSQLQVLPKYIRQYPGDYSFLKKIVLGTFLMFHHPKELMKLVKHYFGMRRGSVGSATRKWH